ncbi:hypothetical protein GCM10007967_22140 [Xylanimonas ulmi]
MSAAAQAAAEASVRRRRRERGVVRGPSMSNSLVRWCHLDVTQITLESGKRLRKRLRGDLSRSVISRGAVRSALRAET